MRQPLLSLVAVLIMASACSSTSSTEGNATGDAGTEASAPHSDASSNDGEVDGGGVCCPPSAGAACCMDFGGWAENPSGCHFAVCDGFRLPTALTKDSHGCDVWAGAAGPVCGAAVIDAGRDGD